MLSGNPVSCAAHPVVACVNSIKGARGLIDAQLQIRLRQWALLMLVCAVIAWPRLCAAHDSTRDVEAIAAELEKLQISTPYDTDIEIRNLAIDPLEAGRYATNGNFPDVEREVLRKIRASIRSRCDPLVQRTEWAHVEGELGGLPGYMGSGQQIEWDGRSWCVFTPEVNGAVLSSVRSIGSGDEVMALVNMDDAPSLFGDDGLANFIRRAPPPLIRSEDGLLTLTWSTMGESGCSMLVRMEPQPRVLELRRWRYRSEARDAPIESLTAVRLADWRDLPQRALPWSAVYFTWRASGPPGQAGGLARLTEYRRTSLRGFPGGLTSEEPPISLVLASGVDVIDQRIGGIYRLGESRVQLQGIVFPLREPLTEWRDLPARLPEILAVPIAEPLSAPRSAETPDPLDSRLPIETGPMETDPLKIWDIHATWSAFMHIESAVFRWTLVLLAVACAAAFAMSRDRRRGAAAAVCAVVLAFAGWSWVGESLDRGIRPALVREEFAEVGQQPMSPLRGASSHRFDRTAGDIGRSVRLRHVFSLECVATDPVTIVQVMTSCGCTSCTPDRTSIEDGGSLRVVVELDAPVGAERTERAWLVFADGRTHELAVSATVVPTESRLLWPMCLRGGARGSEHAFVVEVSGASTADRLTVESARPTGGSESIALEVDATCELGELVVDGQPRRLRWVRYKLSQDVPSEGGEVRGSQSRVQGLFDGIPWLRSRS